jgi:hypothetical protein
VPTQYSSYDKGFDQGHAEVRPTDAPSIGRKTASKGSPAGRRKAIIALAVVVLMVGSGFAMIAPRMGLKLERWSGQ